MPLQYKFVTYGGDAVDVVSSGAVGATSSSTPLCEYSTTPYLSGQLLPLPSSGRAIWVTVIVRNALGSETTMQPGMPLAISAPTTADLIMQLSNIESTGTIVNSSSSDHTNTTGTGSGPTLPSSTGTAVGVLEQAHAAISASLAAAVSNSSSSDVSESSPAGNGSLIRVSAANIDSVLDTMVLTALVLQVTACVSMQCGRGDCIVVDDVPVCDCGGSGFTGAFCTTPVGTATVHADTGNDTTSLPTTPVNASVMSSSLTRTATPSPTPSVVGVLQKACPSVNGMDCSGHGTCVRSLSDCPLTSLQCTTACRCESDKLECHETRQSPSHLAHTALIVT